MPLGLGAQMGKGGIVKSIPSHVTDNLKMLHRYNTGSVVPVSDGAVYLSGVDNDEAPISIPDNASLDFGTGDFSICFWMMQPSVSDNNAAKLCMKKQTDVNNANSGFSMHLNGSGLRCTVYDNDSGAHLDVTGVFSNDAKWEHFAFVFDRDTALNVYVDGVLKTPNTTLASHTGTFDNSESFDIGYYNDTNYLKAYMCNFGVWKGALTQAQIKSIMWKNYAGLTDSEKDAGATGSSNLSAWWNMDVETAVDGTSGSGGIKDSHGTNHGDLS